MDNPILQKLKRGALLSLLASSLLSSCVQEEYDLSNLENERMKTETAVSLPIGTVHFCIGDFFSQGNAKGFITTLDSIIKVRYLEEGEELQFPIIAQKVEISSEDTLTGVRYSEIKGQLDSLEVADLKLEIENQLPVDAELTVRFLKRVKDPKDPEKEIYEEMPQLARSVKVNKSTVHPQTKELQTPFKETTSIKFVGEECRDIEKVTDLIFSYNVNSIVDEGVIYLAKDYKFNLFATMYLKAKLIFDIK